MEFCNNGDNSILLKNTTSAMIAVLSYEVVLKLSHALVPAVHTIPFVLGVTAILRIVSGATLVAFVYSFYREERHAGGVGRFLTAALVITIAAVVLRLPIFGMRHSLLPRVAGVYLGMARSLAFMLVMVSFRKTVSEEHANLRRASLWAGVVFGAMAAAVAVQCVEITRFALTGTQTVHSPGFFLAMFGLFLVTHVAVIYYLYLYRRYKSTA